MWLPKSKLGVFSKTQNKTPKQHTINPPLAKKAPSGKPKIETMLLAFLIIVMSFTRSFYSWKNHEISMKNKPN